MPGPSANDLRAILLGNEHHGDPTYVNRVTLAVPRAIQGISYKGANGKSNNSSFSFGIVQFDIGSNAYAKAAFQAVLDHAVAQNVITTAVSQSLDDYIGLKRPDIAASTKDRYKQDLVLINQFFIQISDTRETIALYEKNYVDATLLPTITMFLSSVNLRLLHNS